LALHKLRGQSRQSIVVVVGPSIFDGDIAILDKAGLGKPALEVEENSTARFCNGRDAKKSDRGIAACWARAVRGPATAPPISVMNSRRLMLAPCAKSKPSSENSVVHHSKIRRLMSALVKSRYSDRSSPCPLYPQKRTFGSAVSMSALCHKRT
jgi:hypothetical protein